MFQKGPGEGYSAAKDACLSLESNAACRESFNGGIRHYRIFVGDTDMSCAAASAREAWNRFFDRLQEKISR